MVNFLSDIAALTGLPFETLGGAYRMVNFDGKAVYFEGACILASFSPECVSIRCKKHQIDIKGSELKIKKLSTNECVVCGVIKNILVIN